MKGILVYTKKEKLLHKQGKLENDPDYSLTGDYYWALGRSPKEKNLERIYFATEKFVRGYFLIEEINELDGTITFNAKSWKTVKPVPCKVFQGFKYYEKKD